jgi:hypothetical protein
MTRYQVILWIVPLVPRRGASVPHVMAMVTYCAVSWDCIPGIARSVVDDFIVLLG